MERCFALGGPSRACARGSYGAAVRIPFPLQSRGPSLPGFVARGGPHTNPPPTGGAGTARPGRTLGVCHVASGEERASPAGGAEEPSLPARQTTTEAFLEELEREAAAVVSSPDIEGQLEEVQKKLAELQAQVDALYARVFAGVSATIPGSAEGEPATSFTLEQPVTEDVVAALGRESGAALAALLGEMEARDAAAWVAFQQDVHKLKLKRTRLRGEADALEAALLDAERAARMAATKRISSAKRSGSAAGAATTSVKIVLVSGFESFNIDLYRKVAEKLDAVMPGVELRCFSDRDIVSRRPAMEAALADADVLFASLVFDFDQVEWLREKAQDVPIRLCFESAPELMSTTQVGTFEMKPDPSGEKKGPPPAVKKVLSLFGSSKEEDKLVGYLSFLKIGPKLLKYLPKWMTNEKIRDLRTWLTVYSYWNEGGIDNVTNMFLYLVDVYYKETGLELPPALETPPTGCLHPDHEGYFKGPAEYLAWYAKHGRVRDVAAPTVAVLLYRKHVITDQFYIPQMIECMEEDGIRPLPIFINGVEAHTIVRDKLTSRHEREGIASGALPKGTLAPDAVEVDAIVNTIGFPLVGGPAGSAIEAGRQTEVAKSILSAMNVPYIVAAPLLIQDLASWVNDGIAGLQSVVLYSLPELDGAIDTVPLGGLVGDNIFLIPERVKRLDKRIKKWVNLRKTPTHERKIAVMVYGFPPGVGATGTAALLNVPKSLEALLERLRNEGYDLGPGGAEIDGEALVTALKMQEGQRAIMEGAKGIHARGAGAAEEFGAQAVGAEVSGPELKEMLTFPETWGPTEWGPIPFLPRNDILVKRMEDQWGDLRTYRGLNSTGTGSSLCSGVQLGNVFIGVQPALGVEGDPMRLLFERDLTPHPQYAAFYKWLEHGYQADAVLHFGMHGTVEWLPGSPLGNSGFSWSDVLLSNLPNVYIYAANNPSESIVAKRRGYGTIVSHNVPPYGRAGLYKQMSELKSMLQEYREAPDANEALRPAIVEALSAAGLQEDCPFVGADGETVPLDSDNVDDVETDAWRVYAGDVYQYLLVVENRLFSEGLHTLGHPPSEEQMAQYLGAYFGEDLPEDAVQAVASSTEDIEALRARLEASLSAEARLPEAVAIRDLLARNTEELDGVVKALNGEYVLPEAGGDLLRDGTGVLPTGRNIHALDPYRMPSAAAMERGREAAEAIIDAHRAQNGGAYPETVSVNLWGLDAIKTKGETVAIALALVGAAPVREDVGRIARFELLPLEALGGRPRIDVLCNMSGIFRDSFQNVVELLDDLFQRAAAADEPAEMNYVRKHAGDMEAQGLDNTAARLFSNPAGDYGSMVNERVGASDWASGEELGDTWASRNAFSYGRGGERGVARPEVLQGLLATTERVVQEIDSVEYGLTDIQEYYANTGALTAAAQAAKGPNGKKVGCSIIESFGKEVKPKELDDVLRLEYRSKLLNPKWADAMADQGSGGAFEISQRMTAMVGWGATTNFTEDWTWDQAADTYVKDAEMAAKLRKANPEAFSNVVKRMLEAAGRGMWNADQETLDLLQELYQDLDDELEGISL